MCAQQKGRVVLTAAPCGSDSGREVGGGVTKMCGWLRQVLSPCFSVWLIPVATAGVKGGLRGGEGGGRGEMNRGLKTSDLTQCLADPDKRRSKSESGRTERQ